jgi:hypothetical protein
MGVLEDAIRDHLELKRKHGASEEEVDQEEAEALGPARREFEAPAETSSEEEQAEETVEPVAEAAEPVAEEPEQAPAEPETQAVPPPPMQEPQSLDFNEVEDEPELSEQRPPRDLDFD